MTMARKQPNANRIATRHQPIAVVFDLVDPFWTRGWLVGGYGKARLNEAVGRRAGQHGAKYRRATGGVESEADG